jgi:hypothetical protein
MTTFIKCLFVLLATTFCTAQNKQAKLIQGKIIATATDLEGIYILNQSTDQSTLSEKGGYFAILASAGDVLLFSSVQFIGKEIVVKETDFNNALLFVKLEALIRELDEVRINEYKNINAVSLGIVPKGLKVYTPAERRIHTASTGGGLVSVDAIINLISGRTAMLKTELMYEKKSLLLEKISNNFDDLYFTETLKIPSDYVQGFKYFIVEDKFAVEALKNKNKTLASFLIGELAVKYLKLIANK